MAYNAENRRGEPVLMIASCRRRQLVILAAANTKESFDISLLSDNGGAPEQAHGGIRADPARPTRHAASGRPKCHRAERRPERRGVCKALMPRANAASGRELMKRPI